MAQSPGGLAFVLAILSTQLGLIPFELFIDSGIADDLAFARWFLVAGQEILVVVDSDELALNFEHDSLADHRIGNLIAVAVIRELAILVHFAENLEGGIVIHQRKLSQIGDLLLPAA